MSGKAVAAADKLLAERMPRARPAEWPEISVQGSARGGATMKALTWQGAHKVRVADVPIPAVTDPGDAVLRVTSTAICGSDLHLYAHAMPGLKAGDVLGHEFMGVVEEVGADVRELKQGDRVVVAFCICGCGGRCFFCKHGLFSSCAASNPSRVQEAMYGQPTGGFFGYSHLTGGWQGGQAEYVRVPAADANCLKVPDALDDDRALLLSDILPTAWHACDMGEVKGGDAVAIFGAGPVGILTAHCAQHRGARRVILIDPLQYRLEHARARLPGVETVCAAKEGDALTALSGLFADEPGGAPDVVVDAVGMHYATSLLHRAMAALSVESDTPEIVNTCLRAVRKGGRVSLAGAYAGVAHGFHLGALMEKQLQLRGGQTPVQRTWRMLRDKVLEGALDPTIVVTHRLPLEEAPHAYKIFDSKEDGCIKVVLKTAAARSPAGTGAGASSGVEGAAAAATPAAGVAEAAAEPKARQE